MQDTPPGRDDDDPAHPLTALCPTGFTPFYVLDPVAGRWRPIVAPHPTPELRPPDSNLSLPLPLLEFPTPMSRDAASRDQPSAPLVAAPILHHSGQVRDHMTAFVYATDARLLSSVSQVGRISAAEAVPHSHAHDFPVSVTTQGVPYQVLVQDVYVRGLASERFLLPEMPFQGISLGDALQGDFRWLADHDRTAWPTSLRLDVPQKLAIVFCFPGYDKYSNQVNILRHDRARRVPYTRSKLAHLVAREMQKFLDLARSCGKPLVYGGRELPLSDLVLIDIQHVSRGSLQPTIGVVTQQGPDNATTSIDGAMGRLSIGYDAAITGM